MLNSFRPSREMHPKYICEIRILIRHNHCWQPVVPPPTFENWLCGLQHGCGSHNWHHVCEFAKPHYHYQDGIIPLWLRPTCHKVHAHTMPWLLRDRPWLQKAALLLVRGSLQPNILKLSYNFLHAQLMVPLWYHSMVNVFLFNGRQ